MGADRNPGSPRSSRRLWVHVGSERLAPQCHFVQQEKLDPGSEDLVLKARVPPAERLQPVHVVGRQAMGGAQERMSSSRKKQGFGS